MIISNDDGFFSKDNFTWFDITSGHQISANATFCSDLEGVTLPLLVLMQSLMSPTTEPQSTKGARLVALPSPTKEAVFQAAAAATATTAW